MSTNLWPWYDPVVFGVEAVRTLVNVLTHPLFGGSIVYHLMYIIICRVIQVHSLLPVRWGILRL